MIDHSTSHSRAPTDSDTTCEDKSSQHSVPSPSNRQSADSHIDEEGANSCSQEAQDLEHEEVDGEEQATAEVPYPGFEEVVFRCLPQTHRLRQVCLRLITSPWFERLVIFVILLNCLTLGMYQPCSDAKGCIDTRCRVLAVFDNIIYGFFLMEMVIKVIAMGFVGDKGYLAETWNRLDMFIIIAGTADMIVEIAAEYGLENGEINLSAIRTIRVLRPLRAINRIPNLRILVMLLLDTLPMLGNVLLICFFVFFIFGILGVQLWAGMLRQRCYMPDNMTELIQNISSQYNRTNEISPYYKPSWSSLEFICSKPDDAGMLTCSEIGPLLNDMLVACTEPFTEEVLVPGYEPKKNGSCVDYNQYYTECRADGPNPFEEAISFDNIASAWIAIFQVISLEGWVDIMYYIQDVHTYWVWVYFLALIVIGAFFMVNLFLVVIATQFSETKRRETEKIAEERKRYKSSTTLTSTKTDSDGCYNQLLKYIIHLCRRTHRRAKRAYRGWLVKYSKDSPESTEINTNSAGIKLNIFGDHIHCQPCYHMTALMANFNPPIASPEPSDIDSYSVMSKQFSTSPFLRRSGKTTPILQEPVIVISTDQDETSFNSSLLPPTSCNSQNGGLKVKANEDLESSALLQVAPSHREPQSKSLSTGGSRPSSARPSPQPSPLTHRRSRDPHAHSPRSLCEVGEAHKPLWRSMSQGEKLVGGRNCLLVPNATSGGLASPTLSTHRLRVPGDLGSTYSIQSHSSSGSVRSHNALSAKSSANSYNSKNYLRPALPEDHRHSFSQLSYMQTTVGCDLCCPQCQHLCTEYQRQERNKARKELKELTAAQKVAERLKALRAKIKVMVDGNIFRNSILVSILINTVMMGVEHYNQPDLLTQIVEYSNYVFIGIFTLEMIFKIVADGILQYIKDAFNVFDGFIVIMSYVEIGMGGESSGLSVLRTFRLLRILKLIRFLPALQRQFVVMVRTLDNVASFFGLLMLFMFIFSVLGMNLFGCLFNEVSEDGVVKSSRRNFDSLLWSLITVFQILTQEDWNTIMYDGMAKTSHWAALYFVALMTIGNYVLFNLLVAILVEGFSSVAQKRLDNFLRKRGERLSKDRGDLAQMQYDEDEDDEDRSEDGDEDNEQNKLEKAVTGHTLPSIITDHADVNSNRDIKLVMPPIITRTDATPRGSPKSDAVMPSPSFLILDDGLDCDGLSSQSHMHSSSNNNRKSNNSTPRLNRKNSGGSSRGGGRRQKSEDKVSLMEAELDVDDEIFNGTLSSADSRSRNSSLRNFDLLQVPGRAALNSNSSDTVGSIVSFDMDDPHSERTDGLVMNGSKPFGPLSLQIPEQHITPPEANNNCNGNINHHPPLVRVNGGLGRHGEHTPLLISPVRDTHNGSPYRRTCSMTSIEIGHGLRGDMKSNHGSLYSRLNVASEMEKQFPYPDQEKAEDEENKSELGEKRSFYQKLLHACRPRGCLIQRAEYSMYILSPTNPVRRFCKWLSSRKFFDYFILVLIGLNCIALAVERPSIPPGSTERFVLTVANHCFTALFLMEMLIKISAKGFIVGPNTYLKDGWNINDGFLVLVSVIDTCIRFSLAESPKIFGVLRVLRLLRALRPLRVISRAPGLKLVVETLLSSLRPIGNIVLICLTFFLIFGILGVQLFRGQFYHCEGEDIRNVTTKSDCIELGYDWENWKYNFDDLGNALMSLFVLSSKDGWVTIMNQGLDARGVDLQPVENYNEWRLLYFISFLLLVGFFVLNMFVGVVVENFHRCREAHEKEEREKREERKRKKLTKKLATSKLGDETLSPDVDADLLPTRSNDSLNVLGADRNNDTNLSSYNEELNEVPFYDQYGKARRGVYKVVTNKFFDIAVSIIIFLNVISMAVEHYRMSLEMLFALKIMNYVFTFIFMLEALFKILAYGFVRYIKERWNQLDMLIIVLSLIGIALEEVQTEVIPINPTIMRVMRILRIARVLKLLKVAKGIRALLDTVLVALPQVGNLGLLFFLLFFIFAALGVELFGKIECSNKNPCEGMGVHANFENSGSAFLTLFRIATGDNWNGIMKDALRENCDDDYDCEHNCCVNKVITPIYFVVFVLTAQFVLVNVVVAVLMKHLEEATIFDGYLPNQTNRDGADDDNEGSLIDEFEPNEFTQLCLPDFETKQKLKQYRSQLLITQHKPLSKYSSLPSDFKMASTTRKSNNT